MAKAYSYYVGNGATTAYSFTQELNEQATVIGLVDYIEQSGTWDLGTLTFTFDTAPTATSHVHILRQTSNSVMVATYPNKSYISSENLDADFRQLLMLAQETEFILEQLNFLTGNIIEYVEQQELNTLAIAQNASDINTNDLASIARDDAQDIIIGNNTTAIGNNATAISNNAGDISDNAQAIVDETALRVSEDTRVAAEAEDLSIAYAIALGG